MFADFAVTRILSELGRCDLLPAILFRTSRRQCDQDIDDLAKSRVGLLERGEQDRIRKEIDTIMQKYQMDPEVILGHPHFSALVNTGTGGHHAGQLLMWRLLLEELMTRGLLRLMIATGTVAAGVDFPARTAIITAHSKRGSNGFNVLTSSEFQQMAGRAGRRGKDAVGICLIAPSMYSDARVIHEVIDRPPEPLRSAYFAAPATVLNLLKFRNVDDLRYTVSKSLAAFLDRKTARQIRLEANLDQEQLDADGQMPDEARRRAQRRVRKKIRDAETLEQRQHVALERSLEGLERLGYVESGGLSDKGLWAANLCTSLVLELGEAIAAGMFEDVSVDLLVGLVASLAGDPHRPYFSLKQNPIKKEYFRDLQEIVTRVHAQFNNPNSSEVAVVPDAALTVMAWMDSEDWKTFSSLIRLSGVAEGDVARLVMQTADHLNQICRLTESHPELVHLASEGRRRLLKPPLSEVVLAE